MNQHRLAETASTHQELVYRLAYRVLHNRADAEDVTQDVFVQIMRSPKPLDEIRSPEAWLARIALNMAKKKVRSEQNRRRREESFARERQESDSPEKSELSEARRLVAEALLTLPDDLSIPIVLYYHEGFKYRQIADVLDCPEGTVAKRIHTAKSKLRQRLERSSMAGVLLLFDDALEKPEPVAIPASLGAKVAALSTTRNTLAAWMSLAAVLVLGIVWLGVWQPWSPTSGKSNPEQAQGPRAADSEIAAAETAPTERDLAPAEEKTTTVTASSETTHAAAPTKGRIAGLVADPDGQPIAGATVTLARAYATDPMATATTDEDGNYRLREIDFKAPPEAPRSVRVGGATEMVQLGQVDAAYELTVEAEGFVAVAREVNDPAEQHFTLEPGLEIRGVVLQTDGTTVGNATIAIVAQIGGTPVPRRCQRVTADAHGEFWLPELRPGTYVLETNAKGFLRTSTIVDEGTTSLQLELEAAGQLVVQAEPREMLQRVRVRVTNEHKEIQQASFSPGTLRFAELRPGPHELIVERLGVSLFRERVVIEAGQSLEREIKIEGGVVRGSVSIPANETAEFIHVALQPVGGDPPLHEATDYAFAQNGEFRFDRVPRGRYLLRGGATSLSGEKIIEVTGEELFVELHLVRSEKSGPMINMTHGEPANLDLPEEVRARIPENVNLSVHTGMTLQHLAQLLEHWLPYDVEIGKGLRKEAYLWPTPDTDFLALLANWCQHYEIQFRTDGSILRLERGN